VRNREVTKQGSICCGYDGEMCVVPFECGKESMGNRIIWTATQCRRRIEVFYCGLHEVSMG
jgi:hypothetical protein